MDTIKKIVFEGKGKVEIFHFQPESVDKEQRGVLYFVGQTGPAGRDSSYDYLLNTLAATVKREYYGSNSQHAQAFESSLKKVNAALASLPKETKKDMELTMLVVRKNQIHFSLMGKCEVILIRDDQLFQLSQQSPAPAAQRAYFSSIVKGKVKEGDKIIVATSGIKTLLEKQAFLSRLTHRSFDRLEDYLAKEHPDVKRDAKGLALLFIGLQGGMDSNVPQETQSFDSKTQEDEGLMRSPTPARLTFSFSEKASDWVEFLSAWAHKAGAGASGYLAEYRNRYVQAKKADKKETMAYAPSFRALLGLSKERTFSLPSLFRKKPLPNMVTVGIGIIILAAFFLFVLPKSRKTTIIQKPNTPAPLLSLPSQEKILSFEKTTPHFDDGMLDKNHALLFTQKNALEANLATKSIEPFANVGLPLARQFNETLPSFVAKQEGKFYLMSYDPDNKALNKDVLAWPLQSAFFKDIAFYGGNTYLLEGGQKQIVKYGRDDLLHPLPWLNAKSQQALANPVSMAADGSLYVLDLPKKVVEFRLGQKKREIILAAEFSPRSKIRTTGRLPSLYLMDPATNRVLLVDKKTGKITSDHTFSSLQPIIDIYPDEESPNALILTNDGVFKVKL